MLDILGKQVKDLELLAKDIKGNGIYLLERVPFNPKSYNKVGGGNYTIPSGELKSLQEKLFLDYQIWYTQTRHLVNDYVHERITEFDQIYLDVIKCLKLEGGWGGIYDKSVYINSWSNDFLNQLGILLSIPLVAEIKEKSLRNILTADIANSEIDEAEELYDEQHYRAAGAVAGVALERYLKTRCEVNSIEYKKENSIHSLAQLLYNHDPPLIDATVLNHMDHLASIRKNCAHANQISDEKLRKDVRRLIDDTRGYVQKL